jgi:FlaG/FlaF family flagellin (archaellin)
MTDDNKPAEVKTGIRWEKSPYGVFETYANGTNITWSLDDVTLRFAQLATTDETLTPGDAVDPVNLQKATVTVSWRVAKVLHLQLGRLLANYEKANGEIRLTPKLASNEGT